MTTRTKALKTKTITDRQRFDNVFAGLIACGVAYWFDLRGTTGVREDRTNDYLRCAEQAGTDLWVGEHAGHVDDGGARWSDDGVLTVGTRRGGLPWGELTWVPAKRLWWSFSYERPEVAQLLVWLFREQGIDAWWSGNEWDSVEVNLETPCGQVRNDFERAAIGR